MASQQYDMLEKLITSPSLKSIKNESSSKSSLNNAKSSINKKYPTKLNSGHLIPENLANIEKFKTLPVVSLSLSNKLEMLEELLENTR